MRMRLSGIGVVIVALVALSCGETGQLPPGPSMQKAAPPSSALVCDFRSLNQLATHYFGSAEAKIVKGLIAQMQTAGAFTATAKDRGFDAMTHIASNITAGNTGVADASNLTNGLLVCMFNNAADLPATFPEDFSVATDPAQHGGYAVRGGATDPLNAAVYSRPLSAPFSGIIPSSTNTWPGILSGNSAPARILVYGQPGSQAQTYDWRVAPRSTAFSPPAIVGVCIDANVSATSLLHEENIGLLPFVDAAFLNPATCSSFATRSWGNQFAGRLVRWGMDILARPLSASGVMNPGGLGGATGGIHSEFGPQVVSTVTLTFTGQPSDVRVNQIITPPVLVLATDAATNSPVPNVSVTISTINNNGTPALLGGTLTQITNAAGIATFADLTQSKTGGYLLVASGTVLGRPAISVPTANSTRFNVRP